MGGDTLAIGRRFMVGIRGDLPGDQDLEADLEACARVGVGGVVLFDRDVRTGGARNIREKEQAAALIRHVRDRLGDEIRVAVDQEGGRVARLRREHGFRELPPARAVAAMSEEQQRTVAREMASDLREIGVDLNFAPCADLDLGCPVVSGLERSYGALDAVVRSASIVIEELERAGVGACIKHFPGHGSAPSDSHAELPDVTGIWRSDELEAFRSLIGSATPPTAVMTAHILHRGIDPLNPLSVSLAATRMLRDDLGFTGLIVTDSLDMNALRRDEGLLGVSARALGAGVDLVLHACNSVRGETACDVARVIEQLARQGDRTG